MEHRSSAVERLKGVNLHPRDPDLPLSNHGALRRFAHAAVVGQIDAVDDPVTPKGMAADVSRNS